MEKNKITATITGMGMYVPEMVLDNKYFESILDTSDEWILTRTGIKERRMMVNGTTSDMASLAVKDLLKKRGIKAEEIDVIIVATVTPDMFFPATACLVQDDIGAKNAWAFDMSAGCSGWLYALRTGAALVESGQYKKVVVIGSDKMTTIADYTDRSTCILFGDLAACALLEPSDNPAYGIQDSIFHVDGSGRDHLNIKAGGSLYPSSHETVDKRMHYIYQEGQAVYKVAVKSMADVSYEIMVKNHLKGEDIAYLAPHQANLRIIDATAKRMKVPKEKVMININKYGNTTGGTIPSCLYEYYYGGKLKKGDKIILAAFGAGYTWGSMYLVWGMDQI